MCRNYTTALADRLLVGGDLEDRAHNTTFSVVLWAPALRMELRSSKESHCISSCDKSYQIRNVGSN